ncbi:cupin domain-containing protein [Breznakia pachnodae]|uniref:Mannose-6-phosphate isomerase-like protein (Cupin superfamily) n=1 Tax=Breznakia pachnodae TaxID=265178 RepID=A0ABU0E3K7_9FIRM|nr:cupin domain-containing protein [Breznakia pachnodae]MDQ0361482.1 mannose-6-phosphate isomerase-like protein (cupin superfamily) [Breznakia pachnodae]
MPMISELGKFPIDGPKSREMKKFYKLNDEDSIKMISGKHTPVLLSIWASNDVMQFGTIKVLTGGVGPQQTEYDIHAGDAVFYSLSGTMTFYIPNRQETHLVEEGDFMFIPANERYKIINYTGKTIEAVFIIAPQF